jgi:phage gp37-like protein
MGNYTWTILEDAVLEALEARLSSQVKTVKSFQGEWLTDLEREGWRLPAVLVRLRQSRGEQVSVRSYDLTLDLTLLAIVRQIQGALRRREGGIHQILEGIRQALWHQDLGLDVVPFNLVREEPLSNSGEYSVYEAVYRTHLVQDF